ncbi:hypothetical protein AKJ16_DCAP01972 [Drosera capensis]
MDIDGGDDGEGDEEEDETGGRFGRELSREGRDEEDGGEEVESCVYVLRSPDREGRAVAADLACTGEFHHLQQKLEDAQGTANQMKATSPRSEHLLKFVRHSAASRGASGDP